ncbi:hydroxysteroid (20-beta) dehydrogenase 2 [Ctenopharyngodon idella]|uniref:hydroxysteroid (20-beta) dehydrogenase 2 n=1 Tax=Ctenopharyngodon idella TaxID=7959 RepID=UPI002232C3B6|nr:hydroxysteroid (20-beta) dehydrogenase 2 [Ctenopharyngodon idella]
MGDISECSCSSMVLCCIGFVTAAYYLLRWSWQCWHGFKAYMVSEIWQTDLRTYGQWAVVTGATSGIGQAYAEELAKRGLNIVLISRSEEKLHRVAKEIGYKLSEMGDISECSCSSMVLCCIGFVTAAYYLLRWSWQCWHGFKAYMVSEIWQTDLKTYGQWAVVTGATSGIGRAYAEELAKRGLNIVLISRSEEKLNSVAKEIESRFKRQTHVIQTDFTEGHSIYPAIAQQLMGMEIGILVNNVGMNYIGVLANFLDVPDPDQRITQVINCNILSVTQMSRLILPGMIERGKGLIINISSEAASQPQPMVSVYSATKIFVTYFSRCLHAEYRSRGITVQCVAPFMVSTNMTHNVPVNPLVKSAASFARDALNTVGYTTYTSGCLTHALQHIALSIFFPGWLRLTSFCVERMTKFARSIEPKLKERMAQTNNKQD